MAETGKPTAAQPEGETPGSNVQDLATARLATSMSPAMRKRVMARAKAIDRLLEDEDEDYDE